MAGMSVNWPMERVQLYKLVFGVVGLLFGTAIFFMTPSPVNITLGPAVAAAGWMGFDYVLDKKAKARQQTIEYALPDILDQLTIIVEAGLGFEVPSSGSSSRIAPPWWKSSLGCCEAFVWACPGPRR